MTDFFPADQAARDAALDPYASFIVQAPAGSGKTGLLTQRFLRLLTVVEQPEEIVAITFTRKAAAEMRERILGAMRAARDDAEMPSSSNERRTRELALAALQANERHDWSLLENPARLRVTTIDAFNAMLARQLPIRSGFGQPPSIAEHSTELCQVAAWRLLSRLDGNDSCGNALHVLLEHLDNRLDELTALLAVMLTRRDLWQRHLELGGLDRESLEAALAHEVECVLGALDLALPLHVRAAIPALAASAATYLEACGRASEDNAWLGDLASRENAPGPNAADLPHWQLLAKFLLTGAGDLRKPRGLTAINGFPAASEKGIGGDEKSARDAHKARMVEALSALEDRPHAVALLQRATRLPSARYSDAQWRVLEALNAVMPYAVLALQEIFRERGEVDFPELAIRARDALGDETAPTDLALRLDHQIRHLLVDEFQDTSHSQIDLLLRLTRDWESGDGRSLFLVGDPMQSIYQFREAEVGHFLAVRDNGLGALDLQSLRLSANFRSQAGIVDWVNGAFGRNGSLPGIFPAQDDIAMGAIAFEPSEAVRPALEHAAMTVHAFPQHALDAEAARVLELVRDAVADPETSSTAVLVRGRAHLVRILPLLRENAIPFRAVELDALESVSVVQDLLALTRALVNPADATALLSVLRAPWCGLELADLEAIVDEALPLHVRLRDADLRGDLPAPATQRLARIAHTLDAAEEMRGRMTLRERVETAWFAMGGASVLRNPDDIDNARLFFELLQQCETAGDIDDVNDLEERLQQLYAAPDPLAGDAVQIMTLHKAKGLQFDTVIIPALDQVTGRKDRLLFHWMERPQPDGGEHLLLGPVKSREDEEGGDIYRFIERLKDEREALERARLLYVGVTRARRSVHLLGKARYAARGGAIALAQPRAGSLLELLWSRPDVRAAFEALPVPAEKPQRPARIAQHSPLYRLPAEGVSLVADSGLAFSIRQRGTASEPQDVIYAWAGERVRHIGTLVHTILERMAREGFGAWNEGRVAAVPAEHLLAALGLPEGEIQSAAADVRGVLQRVLRSAHAAWILGEHDHAYTEWALGGIDRDEQVSVSIDRSFVDADGTRWIIDYKTSAHEGGDQETFLAEQQRRYRGQLERYARLVHALEGRPVKVALYFPMQDAFHAWTPELS